MEPKKYRKSKTDYTDWGHHVKQVTRHKRQEVPVEDAKKPPPLEIELDPLTAQGVYANLAVITHSEVEFVIDFIFVAPNQAKAKVRSRIIVTPVQAKRFMAALAESIRGYEKRFSAGQRPCRMDRRFFNGGS